MLQANMCKYEGWCCASASASSSGIQVQTHVVPLEEEPDPELIFQSDKFMFDLVVMERVVLENIYQPELAAYRQLTVFQGNTHTRFVIRYGHSAPCAPTSQWS